MYAGRIVERAPVQDLFDNPRHPYTEGLLRSMPPFEDEDPERLPTIEGTVASPYDMPRGCAFHPRCAYAWDACRQVSPPLEAVAADHSAACLRNQALAADRIPAHV
jgi:oligopeptide/dipeptide ABC transporter ATP-binding protein